MNALVALAQLIASGTAIANNMRPAAPAAGYKSTEFWLTGILSAWAAVSGMVPQPWDYIIPAAAVGVYTVARGLIKVAHAFNRGQALPELPPLPAAQDTNSAPVVDRSVAP